MELELLLLLFNLFIYLQVGVVSPTLNLQPRGPVPMLVSPGPWWPSYIPRHWLPILVAC